MAPMIRVDDEVYAYLNERGRTEDSFNDVIRRELELGPRKPAKRENRIEAMSASVTDTSETELSVIESALNLFLPPHWADAPLRRDQIIEVTQLFLKTSKNWGTPDREVYAAKQVAKMRGIEVNTVQDKCGRQLYGEGNLIEQFRAALENVEVHLSKAEV